MRIFCLIKPFGTPSDPPALTIVETDHVWFDSNENRIKFMTSVHGLCKSEKTYEKPAAENLLTILFRDGLIDLSETVFLF